MTIKGNTKITFLVILMAVLCSVLTGSDKEIKILPIPEIKPDNLEESVRQHLVESRKMVESVISKKDASNEARAQSYGDLGMTYHAYDLVDAAEACYRNAAAIQPGSYDWNYALAFLLLNKKGSFQEALDYFKRAEKLVNDDARKYLLNIRIGECHLELNHQKEAGEAFDTAFKINPNGAAILARMGETALAEKRFQDAVNYLVKALQLQPGANKLHYQLAMAYRGVGDIQNARLHLQKRGMVGVQPVDPLTAQLKHLVTGFRVHLLAGRLAYRAKRYEEAIVEFRKAVDADPSKPAGHVNLGVTYSNLGRFEEAITQFNEAVKLDPENLTVHFNLGTLYGHLGQQEKAAQHLRIVVDKSPDDAQAHINLGNILLDMKRYDEALKLYRTAVGLDSSLQTPWLKMFSIYNSQKKYKKAMNILEDAYKQLPHNGQISHALARQLAVCPSLKLRNGKRALELALKVYNSYQHFSTARTVAAAYAELDNCDEAIQWIYQAISLAYDQPKSIRTSLENNLEFLKKNRPCRVPGEK